MSEWADPDGRKPLWRVSDLRWSFDDAAAAVAFHEKTIAHFEKKHFAVTPCTVPLGDACSRLFSGEERQNGEPHTEIGFLFRIGTVVAEVEGAEGPRIGKLRINDDHVLPLARRAEERVRAALR